MKEIWDKRRELRDIIIAKKKEVRKLELQWKRGQYDIETDKH